MRKNVIMKFLLYSGAFTMDTGFPLAKGTEAGAF